MISALSMYGNGLRTGASSPRRHHARLRDGTVTSVPLERYLGPADETDERILDELSGPVLDVGCGPGRHLHALAARGVFALGVDLSPVAVALAVGRGGRAIVGDIFAELPGGGRWRSALLLDGNIGIGGCPVRLLRRIGDLLVDGGDLLVELERPGTWTGSTQIRLEADGVVSAWFPWALVAAPKIGAIARCAGFDATEVRLVSGRWFGHLQREARRPAHARRRPGRRAGAVGSVP